MSFPSNWKNVKFGDIAQQIVERIDDPQKSGYNSYIGLEHIESEQINIWKYGDAKEVKSSKFFCQKGDIIFGRRRAYLRKLAVCDRDSLVSTDAMVIRPRKEVIKEYLILMMQTDYFWEKAISLSAGSLSPRVKWRELSTIDFYLPPLDIQKKISDIIWSIQNNLEKMEKLIQITEKLKKGLLEELLTKGIDHKKFKETELGEIPEDWKIKKLGEFCTFTKGVTYKSSDLSETQGDYLVNLNNFLKRGGFNSVGTKRFTGDCKSIHILNEGDLVIANTDVTREGHIVGYPALIPKFDKTGKIVMTMDVTKIEPDEKIVNKKFLYYYLLSTRCHAYMKIHSSGSTVLHLQLKMVPKMNIPIPSLEEQIKIIHIIDELDNNKNNHDINIKNIRNLKKKLTNEFLSGKLLIPVEIKN